MQNSLLRTQHTAVASGTESYRPLLGTWTCRYPAPCLTHNLVFSCTLLSLLHASRSLGHVKFSTSFQTVSCLEPCPSAPCIQAPRCNTLPYMSIETSKKHQTARGPPNSCLYTQRLTLGMVMWTTLFTDC